MDKISVYQIDRLLNHKIKSKAISVYLFLTYLSQENEDGEALIYNTNPYQICRLMNSKNILISHKQVTASLNELFNYEFIHKNGNNIELIDACIGFSKPVYDGSIPLQNKGFVYMSEIFFTNLFYNLPVITKRLFLHVYRHFTKSTQFHMNILKKNTYENLCKILKTNRPQKIRNAIEEVKALLQVKCLRSDMKTETYQFTLATITRLLWFKPNTNKSKKKIEKRPISYNIINYHKWKNTWWKVGLRLKEEMINLSRENVFNILAATYNWKLNKILKVLNIYIKNRSEIKSIYHYFKSFQHKKTV